MMVRIIRHTDPSVANYKDSVGRPSDTSYIVDDHSALMLHYYGLHGYTARILQCTLELVVIS